MGSNILQEFCRSRVLGSHPIVRSISTASASTKVVVASQTPERDSQTGAYCAFALPPTRSSDGEQTQHSPCDPKVSRVLGDIRIRYRAEAEYA
jgi:hypothetical protein